MRGISAAVKRAVWKRDRGQCTFTGARGKRERHPLEFHHEEPYGLGGDRSVDDLRLACSAHNAYMATVASWPETGRPEVYVQPLADEGRAGPPKATSSFTDAAARSWSCRSNSSRRFDPEHRSLGNCVWTQLE